MAGGRESEKQRPHVFLSTSSSNFFSLLGVFDGHSGSAAATRLPSHSASFCHTSASAVATDASGTRRSAKCGSCTFHAGSRGCGSSSCVVAATRAVTR